MASPSSDPDPDPLLPRTSSGCQHHHSPPATSSASTGGWTSALFIIGVEIAERFAFYGISANLISYLTGPLGESTAAAAAAVNTWSGAASMLPLLGAALADSWLGRYRTIVASSVLYISGLGMLALSSVLPSFQNHQCSIAADREFCSPSSLQSAFFYISLYLVAIAQSGHKPCVQAFGADQFDPNDPKESVSRSSFFNWWYFGLCAGATVTVALMSYVQDNIGWGLGFGIPCIVMLLALLVFLLGTRTYRFYVSNEASLFARIGKAFRTWGPRETTQSRLIEGECTNNNASLAEEVKGLARLFPIWATCLLYGVVFAQSSTLFTKQAATLDRRIGSSFQVPAAALQCFIGISIVTFIAVYDRILVPLARMFSRIPSGITMLQRIGVGMVLSLITLATAALVEMKRLRTARDAGLVDQPGAAIPMSLWWMVPQYVLLGAADVFTLVGMQEFFYDQVPNALKSLGLALYLSVLGVGGFASSFLISVIDGITKKDGPSWFSDNLNRAHLDYFYLLLAALSALELLAYVYFSTSYVYRREVANAG